MEMESPPGYAMCSPPAGQSLLDGVAETDDYLSWLEMPADIRLELQVYYNRIRNSTSFVRERSNRPCIWLGNDRRCMHYEWRPDVCREFEIGTSWCKAWRERFSIQSEITS